MNHYLTKRLRAFHNPFPFPFSIPNSMAMSDLEAPPPPLPNSYAPLPDSDASVSASVSSPPLRSRSLLFSLALSFVFLLALAGLLSRRDPYPNPNSEIVPDPALRVLDRGVEAGVSSKSSGAGILRSDGSGFPWTNHMLAWQRTGFHFQPDRNWMNDPNGPLYYKGWYHLFYQYNPDSAVWGNITWGHSVSRDLVNWQDLPLAMVRDQWYDINGVWTGSATILPDGQIMMLYTGSTNEYMQVQNLAVPADLSDPLLLNWVKSEINPVLVPPPGIGAEDFRDPTTAWFEPSDSTWRFVIGSRDDKHNGIALVYSTKDFLSYELLPGILHAVERTGMWECIDFFPVSTVKSSAANGLDTSVPPGDSVKHVIKESSDDDRHDYYAIGTYDPAANKWSPDDAENDLGIGLRYDWGKFYASKTFYDQQKKRRVLWGWISETDSERTDIAKGWASLMGVPRTVTFDVKTGSNLITWPVEEVESLRKSINDFSGITIDTGSTFQLHVSGATQLDIEAEFQINRESLEAVVEADVGYNCSTSGGAAHRGALGPFGLLVLANEEMSEQTATYFYVAKASDGSLRTHFCQDESRSSLADDIVKRVVGHTVPVLDGETLSLRILVDHSIVESFAQGGRASATSRVYPTEAIYDDARVFLFNNATGATVTAKTLKIWEMNSAGAAPQLLSLLH